MTMMEKRGWVFALCCSFASQSGIISLHAADSAQITSTLAELDTLTVSEKRKWLNQRMARELPTTQQRRAFYARLRKMDVDQVDVQIELYLQKIAARDQHGASPQNRDFLPHEAKTLHNDSQPTSESSRQQNRVGFFPVVTWLPQGVTLWGGGMISPHGRFARLGMTPVFSSWGNTGGFGHYHRNPYGYHTHQPRYFPQTKKQEKPQPQIWYDGLRTRYSVPATRQWH